MGIIPEKRSRAPSPTQGGAAAIVTLDTRKRTLPAPTGREPEQKHAGLLQLCEQALGSLDSTSSRSAPCINQDATSGSYPCRWAGCGAIFNNVEKLGLHITDLHIKPQKTLNRKEKRRGFLCEWGECHRDKPFNSCYNLEHHVRYKHTGEKPFACPVLNCHSRFAQQSDLKEHIRLHEPSGGEPKRKKRRSESSDSENSCSTSNNGQISLPPIARFLLPPFRLPPLAQPEHSHDPASPLYIPIRTALPPHQKISFPMHSHIVPGGVYRHSHPPQLHPPQPASDALAFPSALANLLSTQPTPMQCDVHHTLLYDLSCQSANRSSTQQPAPAPGSPLYPSSRPSSPSSQPPSPGGSPIKN